MEAMAMIFNSITCQAVPVSKKDLLDMQERVMKLAIPDMAYTYADYIQMIEEQKEK